MGASGCGQYSANVCVCVCRFLVDLAGSERVAQTKVSTSGTHFAEMKHINGSLTVLGRCVNSLVRGDSRVPYRDSHLTMMLKPALGGNCRTSLVVTCSQDPEHGDQTMSAMRFGVRCRSVTNGIATDRRTLQALRQAAVTKIREAQVGLRDTTRQHKRVRKLLGKMRASALGSRLQVMRMTYGHVWNTLAALLASHVKDRFPAAMPMWELVDLCQDRGRASLEGREVPPADEAVAAPDKEDMVRRFDKRARAAERALRKDVARKTMLVASHSAQLQRLNTMYA